MNQGLVTILIVEDNPVNLDLLVQILEPKYEILTAKDGQEGLDKALGERPKIVLLDLSLPIKSGWSVCEELRETLGDEVMPIVALTAHIGRANKDKALRTGFDDYLTKPIDENQLFETIDRLTLNSSTI